MTPRTGTNEFRFGPAEFYLIGFEGNRPDPATFAALETLLESGIVRLLDFVLLHRSDAGAVTLLELDTEGLGLSHFAPIAAGIAGEEDIESLASEIPLGESAAVVVLELAFARTLAQNLAASGGRVLRSERVPAPVVNAMMDILEQEGE